MAAHDMSYAMVAYDERYDMGAEHASYHTASYHTTSYHTTLFQPGPSPLILRACIVMTLLICVKTLLICVQTLVPEMCKETSATH